MRSVDEQVRDRLKRIPSSASMTAQFVQMVGVLARVNVNDKSVEIPCNGFYPPIPGMLVQLEWRNGQLVVTGPAVPLNPIGTVKSTGSPKCTVTVDSVDYIMQYAPPYTPTIGDVVVINWAVPYGMIQSQMPVTTAAVLPDTNPGGGSGSLSGAPVLAAGSGQFRSRWQSNDVRASDTVSGAWFYAGRPQAALKGATPTKTEIYLPLRKSLGVCNVGVHGYDTQPGGWVGGSSYTPLNSRGGWVELPLSFAVFLRDNPGGISVMSGNGDNQWAGTNSDSLSGALRFQGTR